MSDLSARTRRAQKIPFDKCKTKKEKHTYLSTPAVIEKRETEVRSTKNKIDIITRRARTTRRVGASRAVRAVHLVVLPVAPLDHEHEPEKRGDKRRLVVVKLARRIGETQNAHGARMHDGWSEFQRSKGK